jgi:hypothetical protein
MLVQDLVAITRIFGDGAQGCFDGEISSRSDFGWDLRPVFHSPQIEAQGKNKIPATEHSERSEEKTVFGR